MDQTYSFNYDIQESLRLNSLFRDLVVDVVNSGLERSKRYQSGQQLTLYEKYTRKDACRLLNWQKDESSTMYGYKPKHNTCPIFVTYHKNKLEASVDYGDEFINQEILKWESKNNRKVSSEEVQKIIHAKEKRIDLHLFVKKSDDEDGSDFYYLGQCFPDKETVIQETMPNKGGKSVPVVHMNMLLNIPIEYKLYHYIVHNTD